MKKIIVAAFFAFISVTAFAQIENIKIDNEVTINQLYAGALSWNSFSVDSLSATNTTNVRIGALATWRPSAFFAVKAMTVYDRSNKVDWAMNQYSVILNPAKALTLTLGNMGTLVTEQRPLPTSAGGQFETWTESKIPGMALCAKASYKATNDLTIGAAVAKRNGQPEYQAKVGYKKIVASAFYNEGDKKVGTALTATVGKISNVFVWRQDNLVSNFFQLDLGHNYSFVSDTGYDLVKKDLVRGEWGFIKSYKGKHLGGLFAITYCHEVRGVNGYLFIHL